MSKGTKLRGAFALPGMANESRNSATREFTSRIRPERNSVEIETRRSCQTSSNITNTNDTSCLEEENGDFWSQESSVKLNHLTKSRPKSPARRPAVHTRRRAPSSSESDSFECYAGLLRVSDFESLEDTESKQPTGFERNSRSSSNTNQNKIHVSRIGDGESQQQTVVDNSNSSAKIRLPTALNSSDSSHVAEREMSQRDLESDEDLGDILIADYIDSDDSSTSDKKPQLPNSPPPGVDAKASTANNASTNEKSLRFIALKSNDNSRTTNTSNILTNENSKNVNSITHNESGLSSQQGSSSTNINLPGNRYNIPSLTGSGSQSSARRRRFKPVSLDIVDTESDQLTESSKSDTLMTRTFPGSNSDGGGKGGKEIEWGLTAGALNSSFSESTLKSGTMFDQFLKRDDTTSERNKIERDDPLDQVSIDTRSDSQSSGKHGQDLSTRKSLIKDSKEGQNRSISNSWHVIPEIKIEPTEDEDIDIYSCNELSESTDFQEDKDNINDVDNGEKAEHSEDESIDDDDSDLDEDDIKSQETVGSDYNTDNDEKNSISHQSNENLYHNNHELLLDDINHTDEDSLSNLSSTDDEQILDILDNSLNSLSSLTDTRDNTMYSPGEIPAGFHDNNHTLDSSLKLYPPPQWDIERKDGQEEMVNNKEVCSGDEEIGLQQNQPLFDQVYDKGHGNGVSIEHDTYSNNEEFQSDDDVIHPPELFGEDNMEDLYEPPPMFASDEEEDEAETDFEDIPPPLQLSPIQKKVMPFHKIPLVDWTEDDTLEWLQYVGLGHFKQQFKAHQVDGHTLKNINFQLLEEIGISAPDERELVLAEIYELDNPSEEEHLEAEIQDALETASEQDKEKILAVLTALRSPTLTHSTEFPANSNESPLDSDQGCHMSSDTASVASSVTASDEQSYRGSTDITPSQSEYSELHLHSGGGAPQVSGKTAVNENPMKSTKAEKTPKKTKEKNKKKDKSNKKEKKSFSKFWESLSISHTSSKLTKVFGSKKFNPAMQYLLQAGPQGIVRVWPTSLSGQTKYCSFMVSMTTTSSQVVRMVLEKYDVVADPLRYYLCEVGLAKGGISQFMMDNDCPLTWQCRWNDPEKYRFEMRCRDEGSVRMLFEMEGFEGDLDYRSIAVSSRTPCKEVMPLIFKKYDLPGDLEEYQLMEVSEDNEDDRRVVADHVCPLKLQKAWSEPDHVFRLVRKHVTTTAVQSQRATQESTEEFPTHAEELPHTQSNASSLKDGYETESTDNLDNNSDETEFPGVNTELEEVVMEVQDSISTQQPPQPNAARTKDYLVEAASQLKHKDVELLAKEKEIEQLKKERDELLEKEHELLVCKIRNKELEEAASHLQSKDVELQAKEKEIEQLKKERDELLEKENELLVWRMRNQELVEREEEVEKLQSRLHEKDRQEDMEKETELKELRIKCFELSEKENETKAVEQKHIKLLDELDASMTSKDEELRGKDQEIQRLYQRNSALIRMEQEWETSRQHQLNDYTKLQTEFDNLKQSNFSSLTKQRDLEAEIKDLREENESLHSQLREESQAKLLPEAAHVNNEQIDALNLKLETLEREKDQLAEKSEELQRRNQLLEKSAQLLESMRQENQTLLNKTKEMESMKHNIIKLTSQLRAADNLRLNKGELDDLKLRLSICETEKQQVQCRLEEIERHNMSLREDVKEADRLRKENRTLKEKISELEEVHQSVQSLRNEIKDAEVLREKFLRAQGVEKSLAKELRTKEGLLKEKDGKMEEMDKKIKAMSDAMKKMEAKFRDQKEQRENLNRLLTIIKDKDPSLLKTLHRSIITSNESEPKEEDEEEWC